MKLVIEPRLYQKNIAETCESHSTLVVLPTGLGKTLIAVMTVKKRVNEGKVLFLAPTKPLVEQHFKTLKSILGDRKIEMLTGANPPDKRKQTYEWGEIVVATPQIIDNDLDFVNMKNVALIIFDEAHRAVGNYSYTKIADRYLEEREQIQRKAHTIGMTASPGSSAEKILEICKNLGIEKIEIRDENDEDVKPYINEVSYEWIRVDLPPEFEVIRDNLRGVYQDAVNQLKSMGYLRAYYKTVPKSELIAIGQKIRLSNSGSKFRAATCYAIALKIEHAIELIETQEVGAFRQYFERLKKDNTKAQKEIFRDARVIKALDISVKCGISHKKVEKTLETVQSQLLRNKNSKIIVFTQYRDVAEEISQRLNAIEGVSAAKFIGQTNREGDKGLKQREQIEIMDQFRKGYYNVMVATSVGEEGLDVPNTDLVVFYEPNPSEIRTIQRRGRTGRNIPGKVVFLITRGTRDETFYWVSKRKEKKMKSELQKLREEIKAKLEKERKKIIRQQTIDTWNR